MNKSYKLSKNKLKYRMNNYTKINKLKGGNICNLFNNSSKKKAVNESLSLLVSQPSKVETLTPASRTRQVLNSYPAAPNLVSIPATRTRQVLNSYPAAPNLVSRSITSQQSVIADKPHNKTRGRGRDRGRGSGTDTVTSIKTSNVETSSKSFKQEKKKQPLQITIPKPKHVNQRQISPKEQNAIEMQEEKNRIDRIALIKGKENDTSYRAKYVILNNKITFTIPPTRPQIIKPVSRLFPKLNSIIDTRKAIYKTFYVDLPNSEASQAELNAIKLLSLSNLITTKNLYKSINYEYLIQNDSLNQDKEIIKVKKNSNLVFNFFNCIKAPVTGDTYFEPYITNTMAGSILILEEKVGNVDSKKLYRYEIIGLSYNEVYKMCEIILDIFNNLKPILDIPHKDSPKWIANILPIYIKYSKLMDTIDTKLHEAFSREIEYVYE